MRIFSILIILAIFILFACKGEKSHQSESTADKSQLQQKDTTVMIDEKVIYYTCPMDEHKQIHSREEGKCSECGMELVAGVITSEEKKEFYGCPMLTHSHIRLEKAGACEECGMELKPMRLKKL